MLSAPQHLQGQPVVDYRNRSSPIGESHHRLTSRVGLSEQAVRLTRIYCESCSRECRGEVQLDDSGAGLDAWIGGVFDPKAFDLQTVNQRLRRLKV